MLVVYFHNVLAGPLDAFDRKLSRLTVEELARQVESLVRHLRPLPLPDLLADLRTGRPDPRAVAVTFDDGYVGVARHAAPVLAAAGVPATVFVITGALGRPRGSILHFEELEIAFRLTRVRILHAEEFLGAPALLFSPADRVRCLKRAKERLKRLPEAERRSCQAMLLDRLEVSAEECRAWAASDRDGRFEMLSRTELERLAAAGWQIGSHTRSHPSLSGLEDAGLAEEVCGSRDDLRRLGLTELPFAYPYGQPANVGPRARGAVAEAGYTCALTTVPGCNTAATDNFALHRMELAELLQGFLPGGDTGLKG